MDMAGNMQGAEKIYNQAIAEQKASHRRALQLLSARHQIQMETLRGERRKPPPASETTKRLQRVAAWNKKCASAGSHQAGEMLLQKEISRLALNAASLQAGHPLKPSTPPCSMLALSSRSNLSSSSKGR
jgi:hypothetical protein